MNRQRRSLSLKVLVSALLLSFALFAFSGQAFALPVSSHAAQQGEPGSFTCVNKPQVQAPPSLPLQANVKPVNAPTQAACPNGQVPQPTAKQEAKQMPSAPAPAGAQIAAGYHYVTGVADPGASHSSPIGAEAYLGQYTPSLAAGDSHTLAENAAMSFDGQQVVEVGWTVSPSTNGDSNPHLFVFHWVNGVPSCYNGCGWVQYSSTMSPGMAVPGDGSLALYAIENYNGDWWVGYNNQWIGYFPGSLWSSQGVTFTNIARAQLFGEVALQGGAVVGTTQMGNGIFGSSSGSAAIDDITFIDSPMLFSSAADLQLVSTDPACYNSAVINSNSFSYGGPGCNNAPTIAGSYQGTMTSDPPNNRTENVTLQVTQSGSQLRATLRMTEGTFFLSGTIDSQGTVTMATSDHRVSLSGQSFGQGDLEGSYTTAFAKNPHGQWQVNLV